MLTVRDFFKRWHISLSKWFYDYVFKIVGKLKYSYNLIYFRIFIVFLLMGLHMG